MISLLKKFDPLAISTLTPETGIGFQKVSIPDIQRGDNVCLEIEVTTDASVAPGSGKTLTAYAAFSAEDNTYTAAELATAADSLVCSLPNSANVRRLYTLPLYNVSGQFFYFWFDHTSLAAGISVVARITIRR